MIETLTTLVLGAGASRDFGFPLGWGLKNEICDRVIRNDHDMHRCLDVCGFDTDERESFAHALRQSGAMSIDAFLADRSDLIRIGKLAIAAALIPYENPSVVHPLGGAPTWLDIIFDRMRAAKADWHKNMLSIVTFNYDRLVEQYFVVSLQNRFGIGPSEAIELFGETVRMIHVHGLLDDFAFTSAMPGRTFNPNVSGAIVRAAAEKIRIVHEGGEDDDVFIEARRLLEAADRVVIMGFGYDPTNVKRLGLAGLSTGKWVIGTSIGMHARERAVAEDLCKSQNSLTLDHRSGTLSDFLRGHISVGN